VDRAKKHTCLICGHPAAETHSAPLQCLHCGSLGFFSLFLAPRSVPRLASSALPKENDTLLAVAQAAPTLAPTPG